MNSLGFGLGLIFAVLFVSGRVIFRHEIQAAMDRDPAASSPWVVLLTYSGLHALMLYRFANGLYRFRVPLLPRVFSQLGRFLTGIEIHPAAKIGKGFFIDHGMGVVVGETSVIGNDVTIFQGVTLGGTGKERGKRHPTIGNRVVIGAGAKVLGNIRVGDNAFVGANAVVIRDVPPNATVVGVPGRISSIEGKKLPGLTLDHSHLPDPLTKSLDKLQREIDAIEQEIKEHHKRKTG